MFEVTNDVKDVNNLLRKIKSFISSFKKIATRCTLTLTQKHIVVSCTDGHQSPAPTLLTTIKFIT